MALASPEQAPGIGRLRNGPTVYVREAASHRQVGIVHFGGTGGIYWGDLEGSDDWSPRGDWLALRRWEDLRNEHTLITVRPDGSSRRELLLYRYEIKDHHPRLTSEVCITGWAWDPTGDGIYLWDSLRGLLHYSPATGRNVLLYQLPEAKVKERPVWRAPSLAVSADGKRAAIRRLEAVPKARRSARYTTLVLALTGERAEPVAQLTDETTGDLTPQWSADGKTLFLGAAFRWREGDRELSPIRQVADYRLYWNSTPLGPGIVVWWPESSRMYLVGPEGNPKELWHRKEETEVHARVRGVDAQGRLVLMDGAALMALDPKTRELRRVFGVEGHR